MPAKNKHPRVDQVDVKRAFHQLQELGDLESVRVEVALAENGWLEVQAVCEDVSGGKPVLIKTFSTFITGRGPDLNTVQWKHLTALFHIIDRTRAGLPRLIGM